MDQDINTITLPTQANKTEIFDTKIKQIETTTEVISTQQNQNKLKPSLSQDTLNVYKHKVKFTLDDRVV